MEKWLRYKKILLALLCTVFVFYVTYVNAENLTILGRNAISGKMDMGTFNAYSLYGETVNEEYENEDGSTLKVEDIVRDEIQTKISFRLDNQEGLLLNPDFTITDNIGNTYKGSFVTMNYDEINKVVIGIVNFGPIEPRAEELQFIVRNNDNNQEWVINFEVDPSRYGKANDTVILNAAVEEKEEKIVLLRINSTPSVSKVYLDTEASIRSVKIKDSKGQIASRMLGGFAPFEKTEDWSHEFSFNPIPENVNLWLEVTLDSENIINIPFKL